MSRVLTAPVVTAEPRPLDSGTPRFDPEATAAIEQARREAYARGHADGAASAVENAHREAARVLSALREQLEPLAEQLEAVRRARAEVDVELALAIAEAVVGVAPAPDAAELGNRLRDALSVLDEPHVTVRLHPDDEPLVRRLVAAIEERGLAELSLVSDTSVPPGEARVSGRWARANVGRQSALSAVRAMIGEVQDG